MKNLKKSNYEKLATSLFFLQSVELQRWKYSDCTGNVKKCISEKFGFEIWIINIENALARRIFWNPATPHQQAPPPPAVSFGWRGQRSSVGARPFSGAQCTEPAPLFSIKPKLFLVFDEKQKYRDRNWLIHVRFECWKSWKVEFIAG